MAASRSRSAFSLPRRWRHYNWRPLAGLAGGSLAFSLTLVSYLYGVDGHFFGRLFSAFVVVFGLLAFAFRVAVPFVGWAAANWFGRAWAGAPPTQSPRRAASGPISTFPTPPRRPNVPARSPELYP